MPATLPRTLVGILLASALALGPGLLSAQGREAPAAKRVVPFKMLATNHMVVRAKINGKGPYDLIFDLGAPITLLTNRAGIDSGAIKADAPRALLFSIRGESELKTLEVGDLTAKDLPVIVLDHPLLKQMNDILGLRLDGILGYTFYARYRTTIDYQARQMTFEPVAGPVRNLMKDLPGRLSGPRVARERVLAPGALWGLDLGEPQDGLETAGIPIKAVVPDSPAAAAGLKPGDLLSTIDGRWTTSIADTYTAVSSVPPGQAVPVVVLRDGKELTLTVRPAEGL